MLNKIIVMGRLTRDPELKQLNNGLAVVSFTLAVDRDSGGKDAGERKTDFIDCTAWRNTAEFVSKYFTKGQMAVVEGSLQVRDWTDKNGNKRRSAEIAVAKVHFGGSKRENAQNGSQVANEGDFAPVTEIDTEEYGNLPF